MMIEEIRNNLLKLNNKEYKEFEAKIIPNVDKSTILGIKTPILKILAKEYSIREDITDYLNNLPHKYFEENQLHIFILSRIKDFNICIDQVSKFLPYIDNWATCDQLKPICFKKNLSNLLDYVYVWINSNHTYTVRFGIKVLMDYYLDDNFDLNYLNIVIKIKSNEYYINMMIAWYLATALSKQYAHTIKVLESNQLDIWVHNKTIQKAVESNRISDDTKEYLKKLKR